MSEFSTLRSRRFAARQTESTQQAIAFRLGQTSFALPILAIQKVVPLAELNRYQDRELPIIDVTNSILCYFSHHKINQNSQAEDLESERYLIILDDGSQDVIGLPIDSQPTLCRVSESSFKPIPETYQANDGIKSISSQIIELPDRSIVLLLNPQKLIQNSKFKTESKELIADS